VAVLPAVQNAGFGPVANCSSIVAVWLQRFFILFYGWAQRTASAVKSIIIIITTIIIIIIITASVGSMSE
jgi:hypothetical protein